MKRGPTPWRRWLELGLGAMGMAPDDFWGQSIREWDARLAGFREMHGGGEPEFTGADLKALEEEIAEEERKSAEGAAAPKL